MNANRYIHVRTYAGCIHTHTYICMCADHRTQHLRIAQDDTDTDTIIKHFDKCFDFIDKAYARKVPTLVHCGAGGCV